MGNWIGMIAGRIRTLPLSGASLAPEQTPSPLPTIAPSAPPSGEPTASPTPQPSPLPTPVPSADPGAAPSEGLEQAAEFLWQPWMWGIVAAVVAIAVVILVILVILLVRRHRSRRATPAGGNVTSLAVGKVHEQGARKSQQDCFAVSPVEMARDRGLLAVVADGMGGLSDGDRVSQAAVGAMLDAFLSSPADPAILLPSLLARANRAVNALLGEEGLNQSGSTLAAAYIRDGAAYYLSVGDSRICLLRAGELYQLNREHIYRNELLVGAVNGSDTFEQAVAHPKAGGLTSYLGMGQLKYVDLPAAPLWLRPGDKLVLMSDGVYNALSPAELTRALDGDARRAAEQVAAAVQAKGYAHQDNYTAIIIQCGKEGDRP